LDREEVTRVWTGLDMKRKRRRGEEGGGDEGLDREEVTRVWTGLDMKRKRRRGRR